MADVLAQSTGQAVAAMGGDLADVGLGGEWWTFSGSNLCVQMVVLTIDLRPVVTNAWWIGQRASAARGPDPIYAPYVRISTLWAERFSSNH